MNVKNNFKHLALTTSMLLSANIALGEQTHQTRDLKTFLEEFHKNPAKVMKQLPSKIMPKGAVNLFTKKEMANKLFVEKKDSHRMMFIDSIQEADGIEKSMFMDNDKAEDLVDNGSSALKNLDQMNGLLSGKLNESPWSDDYWAIKYGILGYRYADKQMVSNRKTWKTVYDYSTSHPVSDYVSSNRINILSPSEKYDLLVGDSAGSLTQKMWSEGHSYYKANGKVEPWMGICHGWAVAAFMLDRPVNTVTVKSADNNHDITFYPSDIKSLASLLWANTRNATKFVGGRCNTKKPKADTNGRVEDQDCFDTNPATWHKSVVNQIGVNKRSFVIDATYDYEVWNQPVYSYSYKYFNAQNFSNSSITTDWKKAKVSPQSFTKDKFKKHRSKNAKYIVGVVMDIKYVAETSPTQKSTDSEKNDKLVDVRYIYDLEIDASGNVIGGEWYSQAHPDFLWTSPPNTRAKSYYDKYLAGDWNGKAVPQQWSTVAPDAATSGVPLAKIVEGLISRSRGETPTEPVEDKVTRSCTAFMYDKKSHKVGSDYTGSYTGILNTTGEDNIKIKACSKAKKVCKKAISSVTNGYQCYSELEEQPEPQPEPVKVKRSCESFMFDSRGNKVGSAVNVSFTGVLNDSGEDNVKAKACEKSKKKCSNLLSSVSGAVQCVSELEPQPVPLPEEVTRTCESYMYDSRGNRVGSAINVSFTGVLNESGEDNIKNKACQKSKNKCNAKLSSVSGATQCVTELEPQPEPQPLPRVKRSCESYMYDTRGNRIASVYTATHSGVLNEYGDDNIKAKACVKAKAKCTKWMSSYPNSKQCTSELETQPEPQPEPVVKRSCKAYAYDNRGHKIAGLIFNAKAKGIANYTSSSNVDNIKEKACKKAKKKCQRKTATNSNVEQCVTEIEAAPTPEPVPELTRVLCKAYLYDRTGSRLGTYTAAERGRIYNSNDNRRLKDRACEKAVVKCDNDNYAGGNVCLDEREPAPRPTTPSCPAGTHWDARERRCISNYNNTPNCPSGTHWDAGARRCVRDSSYGNTPNCPSGTHWDASSRRCVRNGGYNPGNTPNCPSGTHWDPRSRRCVRSGGYTPGNNHNCPRGTHWDSRRRRCVRR